MPLQCSQCGGYKIIFFLALLGLLFILFVTYPVLLLTRVSIHMFCMSYESSSRMNVVYVKWVSQIIVFLNAI